MNRGGAVEDPRDLARAPNLVEPPPARYRFRAIFKLV